jgi:hypothetical protein
MRFLAWMVVCAMVCETVATRLQTHTVVMIPSPMHWGARRKYVNQQFLRGNWDPQTVVLIYILGTRTGQRLETPITPSDDMSSEVEEYRNQIEYVFSSCRDYGDEPNNPNGTSATTCKVYEGLKYISSKYESKYVWRGADDAYLNLQMWFRIVGQLPSGNLYFGDLRYSNGDDLLLKRHPDMQRETFYMLERFGPYMGGIGYLMSSKVAEFIGTAIVPPKLTWCEDVMVGMWLLPYQVQWMDANANGYPMVNRQNAIVFGRDGKSVLLTHYIKPRDWETISSDGTIWFTSSDESWLLSIIRMLAV